MSDPTGATPPPPSQPAADAARQAQEAPASDARTPYDPASDPDDTGVPTLGDDLATNGRGFISALFDISFKTFITRRLASAFYLVGLVAIGIGFIVYFASGLIAGISSLGWNLGGGIALIVSTLIIVPIAAFLAIVVLRLVIEAIVALIAIAENTEQTAENTEKRSPRL